MDLFNLLLGIPSVKNETVPSSDQPLISAALTSGRSRSLPVLSSPDFESEIFDLVNEHRRSLRLQMLIRMPQLDRVALEHTQAMQRVNALSHDNWEQKRCGQIRALGFTGGAENVAGGECHPSEVRKVMDLVVPGWIGSPGHRNNIETSKFSHSGISLLIGQHQETEQIVFFATQIFASV